MAYGPNPVTLSGIDPVTEDKYVLQIFKLGAVEPFADVRQAPNKVGRAIFDIQNILQNMIGPSKNNLDGLNYPPLQLIADNTPLRIANGELQQYQLKYGEETNGQVTVSLYPQIFTIVGGKQPYFMEDFNTEDYVPNIVGDDSSPTPCSFINSYAKPLSDNQWTIADEKNLSPGGIDVQEVYPTDQCTKSFYNFVNTAGVIPAPFQVRGIEGYRILQYDNEDELTVPVSFIANTQGNDGGPNTVVGQGTIPTQNYLINTIATGPANIAIPIDPSTTYYYVQPVAYDPCSENNPALTAESPWRTQKYILLQDECNDYPHIQMAWMNSLGMRDQFTFTKKNEKKVMAKRNEYLKEPADYNATSYDVNIHDRGYTTYSQTIKETWTCQTGFINDEQAKLLESLMVSADVNVRFDEGEYANQWVPVRIQKKSYVEKTNRKDRLFQYTYTFTIAHNIKSQRG
jgi:hypothetical protein